MQECDYLREQCTRSMDLSPPPMYAAAAVSPPSSALSAASCELIGAPESSWSPTGVGMPPLETSKMGGLTGGPASNVATATNAPIGGGNNNAPLSDQHHHLLLSKFFALLQYGFQLRHWLKPLSFPLKTWKLVKKLGTIVS